MFTRVDIHGNIKPIGYFIKIKENHFSYKEITNFRYKGQKADAMSGAIGEVFLCRVGQKIEYLIYGKLQPRKWFLIEPVTEEEYYAYYKVLKKG